MGVSEITGGRGTPPYASGNPVARTGRGRRAALSEKALAVLDQVQSAIRSIGELRAEESWDAY